MTDLHNFIALALTAPSSGHSNSIEDDNRNQHHHHPAGGCGSVSESNEVLDEDDDGGSGSNTDFPQANRCGTANVSAGGNADDGHKYASDNEDKNGECSSVRSCVVVNDRRHLNQRRPETTIGVFALPPASWSAILRLYEASGLSEGQLHMSLGWHYGAWAGNRKRKGTIPERRLAWLIWCIYIAPDPKYGWLKAAMLEEPRGGWPWKRGLKPEESARISAQTHELRMQLLEPERSMRGEVDKRSLALGRKPQKWEKSVEELLARAEKAVKKPRRKRQWDSADLENPS